MTLDAGGGSLGYLQMEMGPGLSQGGCKSLQLHQFRWEVRKKTSDLTGVLLCCTISAQALQCADWCLVGSVFIQKAPAAL